MGEREKERTKKEGREKERGEGERAKKEGWEKERAEGERAKKEGREKEQGTEGWRLPFVRHRQRCTFASML